MSEPRADPTFAIVVCAHRPYRTLLDGLRDCARLVAQPGDLVFVDNGSAEELGRQVEAAVPGATVLRQAENGYFCGGYNAGLRWALARGYDFVLILNADTTVANPDFIRELLHAAERWPAAAFLGPLVYLRQAGAVQNTCFDFPSIVRQALIWLPYRLMPARWRQRLFTQTLEREVDYLNGVCVLCRGSAVAEVGLMDERFAAYMEDADWACRAARAGWRSVFVPVPSVVHHEEETGYEPFALKTYLLKRNVVLWYANQGRRWSARLYAWASWCLSWAHELRDARPCMRERHRRFRNRLRESAAGILAGRQPGRWFGPPFGPWED